MSSIILVWQQLVNNRVLFTLLLPAHITAQRTYLPFYMVSVCFYSYPDYPPTKIIYLF